MAMVIQITGKPRVWLIGMFLVLLTACAPSPSPDGRLIGGPPVSDEAVKVKVTRVVDGDTFEIDDGRKVRMIGINTPESVDPRRAVEYYGKEASRYTKSLMEGKEVFLLEGTTPEDRYGRILGWVWLSDGTFVNGDLIYQGYAQVYTFADNPEHANYLLTLQRDAREAGRGLWGEEAPGSLEEDYVEDDTGASNYENLTESSSKTNREAVQSPTDGIIFVASQRSKVYHEQGCPGAERIDSNNLIEFSSEQNAIESGRRMCKVSGCKLK